MPQFCRLITRRWLLGLMSVSFFPVLFALGAWFVMLLEPECFDAVESCSVPSTAVLTGFYIILGSAFLLVLPIITPVATKLPSVTEGSFIVFMLIMLALLNAVLGSVIAAKHGEYLKHLNRHKKWLMPGMVFVFTMGMLGILSTYQVIWKSPWVTATAVVIGWMLYVFYLLLSVIIGQALAAWVERRLCR